MRRRWRFTSRRGPGTGPWSRRRRRRVGIKADRAVAPGKESKDNVRFVLTNIQGAPHRLYKRLYCPRGDAENRIKELKGGLQMDRTSCSRFKANQFRLLLAAAGYALMQELRGRARHTQFARAQVERLRLFLLKLGARVQVTVRRIVVHLPLGAPGQAEWRQIAADFNLAPT